MKLHQRIDYQVFNDKVTKCTIICELIDSNDRIERFEVYAKAICKDPDKFDPIIGKRISETKALIKLHKRIISWLDHYYNDLTEMCLNYFSDRDLEINRLDKESKHLEDLLK